MDIKIGSVVMVNGRSKDPFYVGTVWVVIKKVVDRKNVWCYAHNGLDWLSAYPSQLTVLEP